MTADLLRLDRQLCFPLYAASRLIIRLYQPLLEPLGLTYLQYIVLMVLWEHGAMTVGDIGARTLLDTGTLSPLLKRLEKQGLISRQRTADDERVVHITLTKAGQTLKARCQTIPPELFERTGLTLSEAKALKHQVDRLLEHLTSNGKAA